MITRALYRSRMKTAGKRFQYVVRSSLIRPSRYASNANNQASIFVSLSFLFPPAENKKERSSDFHAIRRSPSLPCVALFLLPLICTFRRSRSSFSLRYRGWRRYTRTRGGGQGHVEVT